MTHQRTSRIIGRSAIFAGALAASAFIASGAFAGECPADKIKPNAREPVNLAAVGVTDTTLGSIDLSKEPAEIKDRELRFRQADDRPWRRRAVA
jgi:hypothetical protein